MAPRPSVAPSIAGAPCESRVLVVDDDVAVGQACARILTKAGFQVDTCFDGEEALRALEGCTYDLVLSDIEMPRLGGIDMLRHVRTRDADADMPVIFMTGDPSLATAIQAIERGVTRYLRKPFPPDELVKTARDVVSGQRVAKAKRMALDVEGAPRSSDHRAVLTASFDRALTSLFMAYQPIVSWRKRAVFGYEALLRAREPSLPTPDKILDAAEELGRVHELGRIIRQHAAASLARAPGELALFVNLHPQDLLDEELYAAGSPLAAHGRRVVLEITERASLNDVSDVQERVARLRALGYRIAVDDLGAGYAGLTTMAQLEPDVAKLDMSLIRNVDRQPRKLLLVRTMIAMCGELGIDVIAEGVETPEERDALSAADSDLMQGYLFAKPGEGFPVPRFESVTSGRASAG